MNACQQGFNPEYSEDAPSAAEIAATAGYAVLEFGTSWCGHCQAAFPAIQEVLSVHALPHIKVFDGKGKSLGRTFHVKLWPTLILLHDGSEVDRLVRPTQAGEVRALLAPIG
jgi:thioredoxin 1